MSVEVRYMPARSPAPIAEPAFHRLTLDDVEPWASFHRRGSGYLVRFLGHADFEIEENASRVICWPAPDVTLATCQHLYHNQVLPLLLARQGELVFHGSAVEIDGSAVAFLGAAGRGKSTLAASFAASGYRFLTDDMLHLTASGDGYLVEPSLPSLRLWRESRAAILPAGTVTVRDISYTTKSRISASEALPHCDEARPLKAVYFLGEGKTDRLTLHRLAGGKAVIAWLRHSFLLDLDDPSAIKEHFEKLAVIAGSSPSYGLDYPRCFDELTSVRQVIATHRVDPVGSDIAR